MTLGWWRQRLQPVIVPLVHHLGGVHPNWLTLAGLALAAATALAIAAGRNSPALLLLAGPLLLAQVLADYLDGAVARTYGRQSRLGALLDQGADRASDLMLSGALTYLIVPDARAVAAAVMALAILVAAYYAVEAMSSTRFDPSLSRTDIHVALVLSLFAGGVYRLFVSWRIGP